MTTLRQKFIDELQLRGFAANTVRSYVGIVYGISKFYQRSPEKITDDELKQYLLHRIRTDECSPTTVIVNVSALRFFYLHVVKRSVESVVQALPRMRRRTLRPQVYSPEQIETLLSVDGINLKHRVILMTIYAAGLRVSEVTHLKPVHILSDRMQIRVQQGKGNKDRYTLLSERLLVSMRSYWRQYRPSSDWLFPGDPETKPISENAVRNIFNKAVDLAKLPDFGGVHLLRHSFATHLLEAGVDVVTLQRLMGHSHLVTTANYLHVRRERLDKLKSPLDLIDLHQIEDLK